MDAAVRSDRLIDQDRSRKPRQWRGFLLQGFHSPRFEDLTNTDANDGGANPNDDGANPNGGGASKPAPA
jgi:hypothetical protein